jgi:hypothetical protein
LPATLKSAALQALDKLMHYYHPGHLCQVYACATALDPRAKLGWWNEALWSPSHITQAIEQVNFGWQEFRLTTPSQEQPMYDPNFVPLFQTEAIGTDDDEFQLYATDRRSREVPQFNELEFWKGVQQMYPQVAKMARKYLSVCASSTPSERCFSRAKLLLPSTRNRLSPQVLKESMLVESWSNYFTHNDLPLE